MPSLSDPKKIQQNISQNLKYTVVSLVISVFSTTEIFLAHLVRLKSEESEMPGNFQVLLKALKNFKYIIPKAKLSNQFKFVDNEFFAHQSFLEFEQSSYNLDKTINFRDFQEILTCKKIFITIFECFETFY
jgi:hypothetical protein